MNPIYKKYLLSILITTLFLIAIIVPPLKINDYYKEQIETLEFNLNKSETARKKAENKQCCQIIQERYNDKMLTENGMGFIIEERPRVIDCTDNYDYMGGKIIASETFK